MLKTLKWVYNLGVTQERTRIAAHLQLHGQRAQLNRDTALDMLRNRVNDKKFSENAKARLDFSIAVSDQVQNIIDGIFHVDEEWVSGASIMFPDKAGK